MRSVSTFGITRHKAIIAILLLALLTRIGYLSTVGIRDVLDYASWSMNVAQHGLFSIYAQDALVNYPPLFVAWIGALATLWLKLGGSSTIVAGSRFIILLKLLPLLAELGIIALAYGVLPARSRLRWLVPLLLALYPGLIVATALWGQIDALFTLPLLLSFMLLRKQHPRGAWGLFALALLVKIQAVVALPLLFVLTFRRFGWKSTLACAGLMIVLLLVVLAPFMIGSGIQSALSKPYLGAIGNYPNTTINAFNLWFLATPSVWISHVPLAFNFPLDTQQIMGLLTTKQAGLVLLTVFVLLILLVVWRQAHQPNEFIWLTALYFGFFMLPTEVHERYLYPAAICSLLSIAADRRMWGIALPTFFTFSYNMIFPLQAPFYWLGVNPLFLLGDITLNAALLNILVFAALVYIILSRPATTRALRLFWAAMLMVVLVTSLQIVLPTPLPPDVQPLNATIDNTFQLRGYRLTRTGDHWSLELYWQASAYNNTDYTVFVHAEHSGQTIAQNDSRPQGGSYPTWRWYFNRWIVTKHSLTIPSDTSPNEIDVGMYDPGTMLRAPATQNGQPLSDNAVRVWTG